MDARGGSRMWHVTAGIFAAGLLTFASLTPASAQGIFERIFGGLRRAVEAPAGLPANIQAFADPFAGTRNAPPQRAETGPASAYCVRTSDGFYFPVRRTSRPERGRRLPCILPGEPDAALFWRRHRQCRRLGRQPLRRSRHRLPLSQRAGRRCHLQRPRPLRPGARRRQNRPDAAAWRHRGDPKRPGGSSRP